MEIVAVQVGSEIRMDSRVFASRFGNKHKNVLALVDEYTAQLSTFGALAFETEVRVGQEKSGGGLPARYALLNEDQAIFLLTLARNSPLVVEMKVKLVQAFKVARAALAPAHSMDPMLAQLQVIMQMRTEQLALASEVQGITARLDASPITSEKVGTIHRLGQQLGQAIGNYRRAWAVFNTHFGLASYRDLPSHRYEEAVQFLKMQCAAYLGVPLLEIN